MDHVQRPADGYDHIVVPYVAGPPYDSLDFDTFPDRLGFPPFNEDSAWKGLDPGTISRLVQSWLYFGLIGAFLRHDVDLAEFVREDTEPKDGPIRRLVSSKTLEPHLDKWLAAGEDIEEERLQALLETSASAYCHFSSLSQSSASPLPEILLSVSILITTLAETANRRATALKRWPLFELPLLPPVDTSNLDPAARLLERELISAGWCPFKVQQILSDYSFMTTYYVSRLRDPMAPHISHAACTKDRCIGNNVDMANYSTRHTPTSCQCSHVSIPDKKMRSIIASGGIPIVRVKVSRNGGLAIQVKAASHQSRYIAISHVWSDGLGNPHANSLPTCQLKRLRGSVKSLVPPIFDLAQGFLSIPQLNVSFDAKKMAISWGSTEWFWLDTLCIPVGADEESRLLKSKAINQMAAIYAAAHQVLVLDSVMQAFTVAGRDLCHIAAQMTALAWLGRCWTYQEGALALALQVQCADCSFDPAMLNYDSDFSKEDSYVLLPGTTSTTSFWDRASRAASLGLKLGIKGMLVGIRSLLGMPVSKPQKAEAVLFRHIYYQLHDEVYREMCADRRQSFSLSGDTMKDFILCWNSLARRTTTMAGDIHVILANLLRLNAFSILAMSSQEERMRAILWSLPGIPLSLLFNPSKERVRPAEHHGNRWMPLWPDMHTLDESPILDIGDDALILKDCDYMPHILVFDGVISKTAEILVHVSGGDEDAWYRVLLRRQADDQFELGGFKNTALLFQLRTAEPGPFPMQAACLQLSDIQETRPKTDSPSSSSHGSALDLKATYDCPATARYVGHVVPLGYATLPRYEAKAMNSYTLSIKHDVINQSALPQRPQKIPFLGMSIALMILCSPFNMVLCAMTAIVVYQNVTQHAGWPSSVYVMSCLDIVMHSYTFLAALFFAPPINTLPAVVAGLNLNILPFLVGLAYAGVKAAEMPLAGLDKVVLGLLIGGHLPQIVMVALGRWVVNVRIYKAWLETYDPDWSPAMTDPILTAIFGFAQLLRSFLEVKPPSSGAGSFSETSGREAAPHLGRQIYK
ncbi:hypothetical protein QBC47DRAFT_186074 [Echria macrotheca]|uniref:Heterokaryon incompatibility domain-containing protein n=1 Tax=Echria macrotheca TaxID=438768 RepID=A0AAJ0BGJ8_9PEZI|nr:hypothetical protein QBC47DRAFT_186074 [Echria macrotheca]